MGGAVPVPGLGKCCVLGMGSWVGALGLRVGRGWVSRVRRGCELWRWWMSEVGTCSLSYRMVGWVPRRRRWWWWWWMSVVGTFSLSCKLVGWVPRGRWWPWCWGRRAGRAGVG